MAVIADLATGIDHWRSISPDNVTTRYGFDAGARVADPADPRRVLTWLVDRVSDDRGNIIVYQYKPEDGANVDAGAPFEANRLAAGFGQRYLKRVLYGNRKPFTEGGWLFELLFDYGEHDSLNPKPNDARDWLCRNDPFSSYRASFEVRSYRLCQRVLMFHHFPVENGVGQDCLVRSTDFAYREIRGMSSDRQRDLTPAAGSLPSSPHRRDANARAAPTLLRLLTWLSPAYPVGGFSYSHGLEWLVETGAVRTAETLVRWIEDLLAYGAGRSDLILLAESWRAVASGDRQALKGVAELAAAFAPSAERRLETLAQGTAFLAATCAAWPKPELEALAAEARV